MMEAFWEFWDHLLFRLVISFVAFGSLLLLTQIVWLVARSIQRGVRGRQRKRFNRELGETFLQELYAPYGPHRWVAGARKYPPDIVREFLLPRLTLTAGEIRELIRKAYDSLGFLDRDVKMARSWFRNRRMVALRRMLFTADSRHTTILRSFKTADHSLMLLATMILARVGTVSHVAEMLRELRLPRRTMEQPLYVILEALADRQLEQLMDVWKDFPDPRVRKTVLVVTARRVPSAVQRILAVAAQDDDYDVRAGAASAASNRPSSQGFGILVQLARDPDPVVRSHAAAALGKYSTQGTLGILVECMKDSFFWVRQNAAASLGSWGEPGRKALQDLAATSSDPFARDAAVQELQRLAVWAPLPGGVQ
jgi:HEAT repeat protein